MKRKTAFTIVGTILLTIVLGTISVLAGSTDILESWQQKGIIGQNIFVEDVKKNLIVINTFLQIFTISIPSIIAQYNNRKVIEQRDSLIANIKETMARALKLPNNPKFDVRIFLPKYPHLYKVLDALRISRIPKKYRIRNIDFLCDPGTTKKLEFEVKPKVEGLVGKCYETKKCVWDEHLGITNETEYNLSPAQISRTASLNWSICCPVIPEDSDDIIAVIALDGKNQLNLSHYNTKEMEKQISAFGLMLYDSVPELFTWRF